jgi:GAF domain-containing protein
MSDLLPDEMSIDLGELLDKLARADLAGDLTANLEPTELLTRVVTRATELVPGATEGALFVAPDPPLPALQIWTGPLAQTCLLLEEQAGDGPSAAALASGKPVVVDDLSADPRWPALGTKAAGLGDVSLLVCPLANGDTQSGLLLLTAPRTGAFPPVAHRVVGTAANRLAIAAAHARKVEHLRRAIDSRQIIGQACGILMERHKLPAAEAFQRLVRASQHNHVKVREIAERLVETGEDPETIRL